MKSKIQNFLEDSQSLDVLLTNLGDEIFYDMRWDALYFDQIILGLEKDIAE